MSPAERFAAARHPVLWVLGDALTDVDVEVACDRFCQEAPGLPVFRPLSTQERPGGALAVARMAEALGASVWPLTRPGGVKTRYFCQGRQVARVDVDEGREKDAKEIVEEFLGRLDQPYARQPQIVLLSDYGKGFFSEDVCHDILSCCRKNAIPSIVDPTGDDWSKYQGAAAIKCNDREWATSGGKWRSLTSKLIVTRGSGGMDLFQEAARLDHWDALPGPVLDVTGAGDMVLAALGAALASGLSLEEACPIANVAAGLKCRQRGASPVLRKDLLRALEEYVR